MNVDKDKKEKESKDIYNLLKDSTWGSFHKAFHMVPVPIFFLCDTRLLLRLTTSKELSYLIDCQLAFKFNT